MKCVECKIEMEVKVLGTSKCAFVDATCSRCGLVHDLPISAKTYKMLKKMGASQ